MGGSKGRRDSFDEMLHVLDLSPASGGSSRLDVHCEGAESGKFYTSNATPFPAYEPPRDPEAHLIFASATLLPTASLPSTDSYADVSPELGAAPTAGVPRS